MQNINGTSLIYVNQKRACETVAKKLARESQQISADELISYIEKTISPEWSLVTCLKKGVAFHHNAMPKYIQKEVVDNFREGSNCIRTLVCTTTLTEGVNTTAKNVIISSNLKADQPLTSFDVKNIKGRAGRFSRHFIGRVISLVPLPNIEGEKVIDFDYYDNVNLADEELIQVEGEDLSEASNERRKRLLENLDRLNIPHELVRGNKFLSYAGQASLVLKLRGDDELLRQLSILGNIPTNEQIDSLLGLCHEYLFVAKD